MDVIGGRIQPRLAWLVPVLAVSGLALIIVGVALVSLPAALIVAGLALTAAAATVDWDR